MAEDTRERIASQLSWWGGIVNLKASNKGPVTRTIAPRSYENDFAWLTSAQDRKKVEASRRRSQFAYRTMLHLSTLRQRLLLARPL